MTDDSPSSPPAFPDRSVAARRVAVLVHEGFDTFYRQFKRLTRESRRWFDRQDWVRLRGESHRRIDLYQQYVSATLAALAPLTDAHPRDEALWQEAHLHYAAVTRRRIDVEVAETFFNAITRKIFHTVGVKPSIEFLDREADLSGGEDLPGLYRRFEAPAGGPDDLAGVFEGILRHPRPALAWVDLEGDVAYLVERFRAAMVAEFGDTGFDRIEVLGILFFRVREAYIVARLRRGEELRPFIVPVQPRGEGVTVDGAIFTTEETLQIFSSTRDYLFVDVDHPADLVRFLATLMPALAPSELYIGIAHHRHGKSLIYRELVEHLESTEDRFVVAPGIKGLVMTVFTMPSYRNVFKIIRDRFDKPGASRHAILESYRSVFRGRRVGRLADTQEFEHLAFARERFTDECLDELLSKAGQTVRVVGDQVIVSHVYIEEKMTPLNIYMNEADFEHARTAIVDYGTAIKELAANDIFAGDLLWKNFGVTRFGRLVLYDYDEICSLRECTFRVLPSPRSWEEEMSPQPWYPVGAGDVFPEEWEPFIVPGRDPRLRDAFLLAHRDLFTPRLWRSMQAAVLAGELHVGLPYGSRRRSPA